MGGHQCLRCRSAIRQATYISRTLPTCRKQCYSSSTLVDNEPQTLMSANNRSPSKLDIDALLSKPTWSVKSLLPPTSNNTSTTPAEISPSATSSSPPLPTITPTQLHHLLRLSALPQPRSSTEEAHLLHTLSTQLHFVRAIQAVDTTGVTPLVTLRDETEEGIREATVGLQHPRIIEALEAERKVGRMGRVRRMKGDGIGAQAGEGKEADRRTEEEKGWDPLLGAQGRTVGRYFVVESGKRGGGGGGGGIGSGSAIEVTSEEVIRKD